MTEKRQSSTPKRPRRSAQTKAANQKTAKSGAKTPGTSAKRRTSPRSKTVTEISISPEQRHHMIEEAAYFIAESRHFCAGDPMRDWLIAEEAVDAELENSKPKKRKRRTTPKSAEANL